MDQNPNWLDSDPLESGSDLLSQAYSKLTDYGSGLLSQAYSKLKDYGDSTELNFDNPPAAWGLETSTGPDWEEDAWLAHGAYQGSAVEGYTIDPSLSDVRATTYVNNNTKKATVAFAGTNFGAPGGIVNAAKHAFDDVATDIFAIAPGQEEGDWQFHDARTAVQKAVNKYGKDSVHVTGHSLGGTKALYTSSALGVTASAFNPGWSPFDIARHSTNLSGQKWDFSRSTAYVVPGDPVATSTYFQPGLKVHTVRKDEKLKKLLGDFEGGAVEAGAGVSVGELLSAVHPVAAAAYTGYGVYTVGKDAYALHASGNFLNPRKRVIEPMTPPPLGSRFPPSAPVKNKVPREKASKPEIVHTRKRGGMGFRNGI